MSEKGFAESVVVSELEALLDATVKSISLNTGWGVPYFEVEVGDAEYIVLASVEDAEKLAQERVEEDLVEEPELFNRGWLESLMRHRLKDESFLEYASRDAINVDGFAHFLAHYDHDYEETESDFVVMRVN